MSFTNCHSPGHLISSGKRRGRSRAHRRYCQSPGALKLSAVQVLCIGPANATDQEPSPSLLVGAVSPLDCDAHRRCNAPYTGPEWVPSTTRGGGAGPQCLAVFCNLSHFFRNFLANCFWLVHLVCLVVPLAVTISRKNEVYLVCVAVVRNLCLIKTKRLCSRILRVGSCSCDASGPGCAAHRRRFRRVAEAIAIFLHFFTIFPQCPTVSLQFIAIALDAP